MRTGALRVRFQEIVGAYQDGDRDERHRRVAHVDASRDVAGGDVPVRHLHGAAAGEGRAVGEPGDELSVRIHRELGVEVVQDRVLELDVVGGPRRRCSTGWAHIPLANA